MSTLIAVAALSARMLAEAARDGGYRVVALDLFGDADTRRAAEAWRPIGSPDVLAIDGAALLVALRRLRRDGALGWIAGSGFEDQPALLAAAAQVLPLLGNPPAVVARVRDPAVFYRRLGALGVPCPETRLDAPQPAAGWLRKNAASSGGREVWPAGGPGGSVSAGGNASIYYQRLAAGKPMSALFLANGSKSRLLGVNRQLVRRLAGRPYVFRGCIGPLVVPPAAARRLDEMLDALAANFGLRGLNGLDFLLDGEAIAVLELNPRPPASIALYREALPGGLLRAHLAACLEGRLPRAAPVDAVARPGGFEVLYAGRAHRLDAQAAAELARTAWCHDLPADGARVGRGEPLCTVSATGGGAAAVRSDLRRRGRQISIQLEQSDVSSRKKYLVDQHAPERQ